MSYWLDPPRHRHEVVTVRVLWVTIALSVLVHVTALFLWSPRTRPPGPGSEELQQLAGDRLRVRLAAVARAAPIPAPEPTREIVMAPKPPARAPAPTLRPRAPSVLTAPTAAAPVIPAPPPATSPVLPAPPPPRTAPPVEGDLWSYIQARRRERGEPQAAPIDAGKVEPNASLAANLPAPATGVAAQERKRGGGIFEIKRMEYDNAAFEFFGWNNEMGRKTPQLIEVRKGDNSDMRIAVVRKMIAIIRDYSKGDFVWRSPRHENGLVLSARVSDNAELENFLMHDFFDEPRQLP